MKNLIYLVLLLSIGANAQVKQYLGGPNTQVINRGILHSQVGLAPAADTTLPAWAPRDIPYLAEMGSKLYRWSTSLQAWVEVGNASTVTWSDIAGDPADATVLFDTLHFYQYSLPVGDVTEYYRGDQTLSNFEGDVITVTSPLYIPIADSLKKIRAHSPLYFSDSDSTQLWIDGSLAYYNANELQGYEIETGTPADGSVLTYSQAAGRWMHSISAPAPVAYKTPPVMNIAGMNIEVKDMMLLGLGGLLFAASQKRRKEDEDLA